MSENDSKNLEKEIEQIMTEIRSLPVDADPFLASRVLSQLRGKKESKRSLSWWKGLAITSSAFSILAIGFFSFMLLKGNGATTYEAYVNQPFVVKIELKDLNPSTIAKAKIELPEGVYFDVEDYPELRNERSLVLHWTQNESGTFPFVLKAEESGIKKVTVKFLGADDAVIAERIFNIQMKTYGA